MEKPKTITRVGNKKMYNNMRKKVLLLAAIAMLGCMSVNAQEGSNNGKWAIETEIIPNFNASDWFVPNMTFGYTLNSGNQIYASIEVNTHRTKDCPNNGTSNPLRFNYATDAAFNDAVDAFNHAMNEWNKSAYGDFSLGLGYQYYFVKDGKFRPFVNAGIDLVFAWANMSGHYESQDPISNDWYTDDFSFRGLYTDGVNTYHKGFGLQLDLGLGFDYFIYKGIYIGAELGLSYDMFWMGNAKGHSVTTDPTASADMREIDRTFHYKEFTSEGYQWVTPNIRIGWRF